MEIRDKEVYFSEYCSKCKNSGVNEGEEPCNTCLSYPSNEDSHKPIYFERRTNETDTVR